MFAIELDAPKPVILFVDQRICFGVWMNRFGYSPPLP